MKNKPRLGVSRFVEITPFPAEGVYRTLEPITLISDWSKPLIEVPRGFYTDGASIPRLAWITTGTPFDPRYIGAAIIHDYLYMSGERTRKRADEIFRELLVFDGASKYQSYKMYFALRAFGWIAWKRYRRAEERRSSSL